uniref:Cell division protein n=1 Tax=Pleurastrum terricola TaxID=34116 RepID=A6YG75_PLETE|nr:cell division protein [Pleurastrum terricola]ABO69296.1 cell division protein [Pleurastrum terricola]
MKNFNFEFVHKVKTSIYILYHHWIDFLSSTQTKKQEFVEENEIKELLSPNKEYSKQGIPLKNTHLLNTQYSEDFISNTNFNKTNDNEVKNLNQTVFFKLDFFQQHQLNVVLDNLKQNLGPVLYNFWLEVRYFYTKGAQKQITIIWKQLFFFQDARHIMTGFSVIFFVSFRVIGWKGWLITQKNTTLPATIVSFQKLPYEAFLKQDRLELESTPDKTESVFIEPVSSINPEKYLNKRLGIFYRNRLLNYNHNVKNCALNKTTKLDKKPGLQYKFDNALNSVSADNQSFLSAESNINIVQYLLKRSKFININLQSKELVGNKLFIQNRFTPNTVWYHVNSIPIAYSPVCCSSTLSRSQKQLKQPTFIALKPALDQNAYKIGYIGMNQLGFVNLAPLSGVETWVRHWYQDSKNYPKQFKISNLQNLYIKTPLTTYLHPYLYKKFPNIVRRPSRILAQKFLGLKIHNMNFLANPSLQTIISPRFGLYTYPYLTPRHLKSQQYQKYYQKLTPVNMYFIADLKLFMYNVASTRLYMTPKQAQHLKQVNINQNGIIHSWPKQIMESTSSAAVEFISNLHIIPSYIRPHVVPEVPKESKFDFVFHHNIKWPQTVEIKTNLNPLGCDLDTDVTNLVNSCNNCADITKNSKSFNLPAHFNFVEDNVKNVLHSNSSQIKNYLSHKNIGEAKNYELIKSHPIKTGHVGVQLSKYDKALSVRIKEGGEIIENNENEQNLVDKSPCQQKLLDTSNVKLIKSHDVKINLSDVAYILQQHNTRSSKVRAEKFVAVKQLPKQKNFKTIVQNALMNWKNMQITSALIAEKRNYAGFNFNNLGCREIPYWNFQSNYITNANLLGNSGKGVTEIDFHLTGLTEFETGNSFVGKPIKKPIKLRTLFNYDKTIYSKANPKRAFNILKIKPVAFTRTERERQLMGGVKIDPFVIHNIVQNANYGNLSKQVYISKQPAQIKYNQNSTVTLKKLQTLWANHNIKAVEIAKRYLASCYVESSVSKAQNFFLADGNIFQKPSNRSLKAKNVESPLKGQLRNRLSRFRRFSLWQHQINQFRYGPFTLLKNGKSPQVKEDVSIPGAAQEDREPSPTTGMMNGVSFLNNSNTLEQSSLNKYEFAQDTTSSNYQIDKGAELITITNKDQFSPIMRRRTQDKQGVRRLNRPINVVPSIETKRLIFLPTLVGFDFTHTSMNQPGLYGVRQIKQDYPYTNMFEQGAGKFMDQVGIPGAKNSNMNFTSQTKKSFSKLNIGMHIPLLIENHTKQVQTLLAENAIFEQVSLRLQTRLKKRIQANFELLPKAKLPKKPHMGISSAGNSSTTNSSYLRKEALFNKSKNELLFNSNSQKYLLVKSKLVNRVKNIVLKKAINLAQNMPPEIKVTLINPQKKIEWPRSYLDYDSFYRYFACYLHDLDKRDLSSNRLEQMHKYEPNIGLSQQKAIINSLNTNYLTRKSNTIQFSHLTRINNYQNKKVQLINYNFIPWAQNYDDIEQVINKNRIKVQYFRQPRVLNFETRTLFQSFMRFFNNLPLTNFANINYAIQNWCLQNELIQSLAIKFYSIKKPATINQIYDIKSINLMKSTQHEVTRIPGEERLKKNKQLTINTSFPNRQAKLIESTPSLEMSWFNFSGIAFIMFIVLMLRQLYVYYGEELINLSKSLDIEYMASTLPQILGQINTETDSAEAQTIASNVLDNGRLSKNKAFGGSNFSKNTNDLFLRDVLGLESSLPILGEIVWFFKNNSKLAQNSVINKYGFYLLKISQIHNYEFAAKHQKFGFVLKNQRQINKREELMHMKHSINFIVPKAILLTGPPGIGKTYLSRALAAEAGVPIISRSGGDFTKSMTTTGDMEMSIQHEKESKDAVNELFTKAREIAPCLVFIDEIDAIAQSRNQLFYDVNIGYKLFMRNVRMDKKIHINTPDKEIKRKFAQAAPNSFIDQQKLLFLESANPILPKERELERWEPNPLDTLISRESEFLAKNYRRNVRVQGRLDYAAAKDFQAYGMLIEFLIELDNLRKSDGIVILGATNRLSALDAAFIRSGRFDGLVNIELPGKLQRIQLLQKLMFNKLSNRRQIRINELYKKSFLNPKNIFSSISFFKINTKNGIVQKNIVIPPQDLSWDYIGNRTEGLSGAEIATLINQSVIESVILNLQTHTTQTIEKAIDRLISLNEDTVIHPQKDWTDQLIVIRQAFYQAAKATLFTLLPEHPPAIYLPLWPRKPNPRSASTATQLKFKIPEFSSGIFYSKHELEIYLIGLFAGKAGEQMLIYQNFHQNSIKLKKDGCYKSKIHLVDESPCPTEQIHKYESKIKPTGLGRNKIFDAILWQSGMGQIDLETAKDLLLYMIDDTFLYSQQFANLKFNPLEITQLNYKLGGTNLIRNTVTSELFIKNIGTPAKMVQTPIIRRLNMTSPPKLMILQLYDWELVGTKNSLWYRFWTRDRRERAKLNVQWIKPEKFFHAQSNTKNCDGKFINMNLQPMKLNSLPVTKQLDYKTDYKAGKLPNRKLSYNNRYHNIRGRLFHILSLKSFNAAFLILDRHREILDYFAIHLLRESVLRQSDIRAIFRQFGYSIDSTAFGYTLEAEM